jgi:AcrR family transcriptional regulator
LGATRRGKPRSDEDRGLTHDKILDGALALIDRSGFEKFSVRLLAQHLSVFPAAIYWRFPTRSALLAELVNHLCRDIRIEADPNDWKAWLTELFRQYRAVIYRHPNVAPLYMSQLLSNAGADFALQDQLMGVLKGAGFTGDRLLSAHDIVTAAAVGFATMELAALPEDEAFSLRQIMEKRIDEIDPAIYPNLAEHRDALRNRHFVLRWENGIANPLERSFEDYTYTVIQGLRQLLTR